MIGVWNRSHYEDVLVVRVHKLVPKKVWKARYDQTNHFEEILSENGTTIVKFMLHISKDEQKRRLQARLDRPDKWWKFNPNDLTERARWGVYQKAYEDAIIIARPNVRPGMLCRRTTNGRATSPWPRLSCAPSKRWTRVIPSFRSILRRLKSSKIPNEMWARLNSITSARFSPLPLGVKRGPLSKHGRS
jgi:hypothetical protein